jgi:hypothetical protein
MSSAALRRGGCSKGFLRDVARGSFAPGQVPSASGLLDFIHLTEQSITVREAALEFGVDPSTVRRWITGENGPPCARPGQPGRGRGALVNLEDLRRWRAQRAGIVVASAGVDLDGVARGLLAAFKRGNAGETDPIWRQLGDKSNRGALILSEAYTSIAREVTGREPETVPPEIETLRKCAVLLMLARTSPRG